ncbi:MAG: hypothetical protein GXP62_17235 [Oligoflexia bacterium]|nr:hypothetical protein [Oligoflexia bacterium]
MQAAFAPDARVERHGWDASRGHVMESFTGHTQIAAWCARSPRNVQFDLCSTPVRQGETIAARYSVRVGDYENHGMWRAKLAEDGRLSWLHQPDDLPDEWRDGVPAGKSLGPPSPEVVTAAAHGHKHDHDPK